MISLSREEKDLVLDYFFECGTDEQFIVAQKLIDNDNRAKELYHRLKNSLGHLEYMETEPCPEDLAEITINKLKLASAAENARLETLLAEEGRKECPVQAHPVAVKRSFWHNMADVAAIAAVILMVASVSMPTFSHMRQKAWQTACKAGLGRVGAGVSRYAGDNDQLLPSVATVTGSPWWKVGDQGHKNQSNTRHPWVLVKNGYVNGRDFTCPGRTDTAACNYTRQQLERLHDFPSRRHISYSYMFMCDERAKRRWNGRTVILADRNPIFEKISPETAMEEFKRFSVSDELLKAMSSNHRRGQMLLFYDGSVVYKKVRIISGDDIYTARDRQVYTGCETPGDIQDIFLIP